MASQEHVDYDGLVKALPAQAILALLRIILPGLGTMMEPFVGELALLPHLRLDEAYRVMFQGKLCLLHSERYLPRGSLSDRRPHL